MSSVWLCQDTGLRNTVSAEAYIASIPCFSRLQTSFLSSRTFRVRVGSAGSSKRTLRVSPIKCEKKKDDEYREISVEKPPYYSYMDSTSGQLEPASGARASIPGQEYWPEGTASRVRAARAPKPEGKSLGSPSFGKNPGSRRKKQAPPASSSSPSSSSQVSEVEISEDLMVGPDSDEPTDASSEYVVFQTEPEEGEEEEESEYDMNKRIGNPHPMIDPRVKKPITDTLTSDELWWNWRKPDKEQWSRWQRRRPDVETVFLKAMAETGQIKLYGDVPTLTETALYRARRHLYKEERLQAEEERLEKEGTIAYYSEWVKAWKKDTSKEAIEKHFEETGEDEVTQLIEMFSNQTDREYRIMMGTDKRIKRDPLAMRMREDLIKQIWGGDPVYPTINYIQDPNQVIDYRGANFHEPTPNMLDYLKEQGKVITREEINAILAKEKTEEVQAVPDMEDAMARAIDIGENDSEVDSETEDETSEEDSSEKVNRNWSVWKTTPQSKSKSKGKAKKDGPVSLDDAVDESENLTDFLLDFDEEEQ